MCYSISFWEIVLPRNLLGYFKYFIILIKVLSSIAYRKHLIMLIKYSLFSPQKTELWVVRVSGFFFFFYPIGIKYSFISQACSNIYSTDKWTMKAPSAGFLLGKDSLLHPPDILSRSRFVSSESMPLTARSMIYNCRFSFYLYIRVVFCLGIVMEFKSLSDSPTSLPWQCPNGPCLLLHLWRMKLGNNWRLFLCFFSRFSSSLSLNIQDTLMAF